jgi:antitoxin MazE
MTAKIISIGNSRGIRIPNSILKAMNAQEEVSLVYDDDKEEIVIRPLRNSRKGWADSFRKMRSRGDDRMVIAEPIDNEDGWEW